ncbi:hypothetical protein C6V83_18045 [Gordonia iterans]|uniref:Uncharacterized protein n=1 Tax=Gordonia iterans TaxID=1004901 RepID=A0A2S0KJN2_9ACTN|nr:hypothetical protein [Gordonia iterans]AVM01880.1 hypothetical protein C6V83_18045 [Gordonia iterans]
MTTLCEYGDIQAPISNIRLVGCDDGDIFHLLGDQAGAEGAEILEEGMKGLIEAQVRTVERTPVRSDGAILRAVKTAVMEIELELSISSLLVDESFAEVDGKLREAFSFELDHWYPESTLARIEWETADGVRWLDVVLTAGHEYKVERDPNRRGFWFWTVKLKAYNPFWQAEPDTSQQLTFTEPGVQTVIISNPTGVPMYQQWSATIGQWRLPDCSWAGKKWERVPGGPHADRTVLYPPLSEVNGGLVVDYRPGELAVRDKYDTNLIGVMPVPGDYPQFWVPPFTPPTELDVEAVAVPENGAGIKLIQPRQYRRPWGRV